MSAAASAPPGGSSRLERLAAGLALVAVPVLELGLTPAGVSGIGSPALATLIALLLLVRVGWALLASGLAVGLLVARRPRAGLATALALHPVALIGVLALLGVELRPWAALGAVLVACAPRVALELGGRRAEDTPAP